MQVERLVVTGGRKFDDSIRIEADLRRLVGAGLRRVVQGGNGLKEMRQRQRRADNANLSPEHSADALAEFFRQRIGIPSGKTYDADWSRYKDAAGPIRNEEMLDAEVALARAAGEQLGLAAYPEPPSTGTFDCLAKAIERNVGAMVWLPWAANPATVIHTKIARYGIRKRVPMEVLGHRVLIPPMREPADWLARARVVWQ